MCCETFHYPSRIYSTSSAFCGAAGSPFTLKYSRLQNLSRTRFPLSGQQSRDHLRSCSNHDGLSPDISRRFMSSTETINSLTVGNILQDARPYLLYARNSVSASLRKALSAAIPSTLIKRFLSDRFGSYGKTLLHI